MNSHFFELPRAASSSVLFLDLLLLCLSSSSMPRPRLHFSSSDEEITAFCPTHPSLKNEHNQLIDREPQRHSCLSACYCNLGKFWRNAKAWRSANKEKPLTEAQIKLLKANVAYDQYKPSVSIEESYLLYVHSVHPPKEQVLVDTKEFDERSTQAREVVNRRVVEYIQSTVGQTAWDKEFSREMTADASLRGRSSTWDGYYGRPSLAIVEWNLRHDLVSRLVQHKVHRTAAIWFAEMIHPPEKDPKEQSRLWAWLRAYKLTRVYRDLEKEIETAPRPAELPAGLVIKTLEEIEEYQLEWKLKVERWDAAEKKALEEAEQQRLLEAVWEEERQEKLKREVQRLNQIEIESGV